jgi:peptidoglycan-associated lipoprotein
LNVERREIIKNDKLNTTADTQMYFKVKATKGIEMKTRAKIVNGAVLLSICIACSHGPQKAAAVAMPSGTRAVAGTAPTASSPISACSSDSDCGDKQLCIRSQCVDITAELAECSTVRVHFDLNDANLHETAGPKLERVARCLKADHDLHVMIEGNADERGTEEWNIALGDQRATAVAQYLERLGVSPPQLKTVSYGKERPLCEEHNEECWSKNRRAAVKPHVVHR